MIATGALLLWEAAVVSAAACPDAHTQPGGALTCILREQARFSPEQIATVESGGSVGKAGAASAPAELLLVGAIRLTVPRSTFVAWYREPRNWTFTADKRRPAIEQAALLTTPPLSADFAALRLGDTEARQLSECRPGRCELKLDEALLRAAAENPADAEAAFRQAWRQTAEDYQQHGNGALAEYLDRQRPTAAAAHAGELLANSAILTRIAPHVAACLAHPGAAAPAGCQNIFYWTRERYGFRLKPTHGLYHAVIAEAAPGITVIAAKQLRATHYFQGSLAITLLIDRPEDGTATLVYFNRFRVDALEGGWGGWIRAVVSRAAPAATRRELEALARRVEAWSQTVVSDAGGKKIPEGFRPRGETSKKDGE